MTKNDLIENLIRRLDRAGFNLPEDELRDTLNEVYEIGAADYEDNNRDSDRDQYILFYMLKEVARDFNLSFDEDKGLSDEQD